MGDHHHILAASAGDPGRDGDLVPAVAVDTGHGVLHELTVLGPR